MSAHASNRDRRIVQQTRQPTSAALFGIFLAIANVGGDAQAQPPGPVQPWGLPPLPAGVGPVEKFADVSNTPQGQFLEGGAFDTQGNLWFVAIGSGWVSYLTRSDQRDLSQFAECQSQPRRDVGHHRGIEHRHAVMRAV